MAKFDDERHQVVASSHGGLPEEYSPDATETEYRSAVSTFHDSQGACDKPSANITHDTKKQLNKKLAIAPYDWKPEVVEALIAEWEINPILYDTSHPDYHKAEKRRLALEGICDSFKNYSPAIENIPTIKDVTSKMNTLRSYYNAERNKLNSRVQGSKGGIVEVVKMKSRWHYFDSLDAFLAGHVTPRNTCSHNPDECTPPDFDADFSSTQEPTISASSLKSSRSKRKREPSPDSHNEQINTSVAYLTKNSTLENYDNGIAHMENVRTSGKLFGELVAQTFDEIPDGFDKDMLKLDIMKRMMEVKYGAISRGSRPTRPMSPAFPTGSTARGHLE